jgi:hypothetical protein
MKEYTEFDKWLEKQDESVKALIADRFTALENTVRATREERDSFSIQLKEVGSKLEKGSEAELKIAELNNKLTQATKKATFLEMAQTAGCLRPNAAFAIATAENLFNEQGEPDFKKLKESTPELFKVANMKTNAGAGTQTAISTDNPNDAFRAAAHKNQ